MQLTLARDFKAVGARVGYFLEENLHRVGSSCVGADRDKITGCLHAGCH